ncbi:hypothetical protein D9619_004192 [Psilocybe cf. subviscida]|uniref:Autophagy-related protein 17 n=1 Tax=Psilocybe cf. subviscida TaxID=2480587 RepID=A0A8H5BQY8_9AGAR|nr:hypothetical protein D9619_004192 [Psilocybe cf. subviscida]
MSYSNAHQQYGSPSSQATVPAAAAQTMDKPHLVSLVLKSKKGLQHGEQLCMEAHSASHASAQAAVDVLALDAKVRWISEAVVEQLKLAACVAKTIEEKRDHLAKQIREWDTTRSKRTDALDAILEALGSQVVPPEFHQTSIDSSLFGSQHPSDLVQTQTSSGQYKGNPANPPQVRVGMTPYTTRNGSVKRYANEQQHKDRTRWKTLRDFVDDQAIDDMLEMIESDRAALDATIGRTDDYPETLTRTIDTIRTSLPLGDPALSAVQSTIMAQEEKAHGMAVVLEILAKHYDNMAEILKDTENGEVLADDEWQAISRDTEELPVIMAELQESAHIVAGYHDQLRKRKEEVEQDMEHLARALDDLDELGDIMGEMLATQDSVEHQASEELQGLHEHLTTLEHLYTQYVSYRTAFNKLLVEMARRRQYWESAENIVRSMMMQLHTMSEDESVLRENFNVEYGQHLPEDLCLCIGNAPTKWEILPWQGSEAESLPFIDNDLVAEAKDRVERGDRYADVRS